MAAGKKSSSPAKKKKSAAASPAAKRRGVDHATLLRASKALLSHTKAHASKKKKKSLLDDDEESGASMVLVSFALKRAPERVKKTFKGWPIRMPKPLGSGAESVCLLVKDKKEAEARLEKNPVPVIKEIISLARLRTAYHQYSERRELAARHDYFLADDRIVCMLPKALGRAFYSGAKRPLPVRFAKNDGALGKRVARAMESTYFYMSGTCSTLRVARTSFTPEEVATNALAGIEGAVKKIPGEWKGVQAIHLKTSTSVALPVYASAPASEE